MTKIVAGVVVNGCTLTGFEKLRGEVNHLTDCSEFVKPGWRAKKRILRAIHRVKQYRSWWEEGEEARFLEKLEKVLEEKSPRTWRV